MVSVARAETGNEIARRSPDEQHLPDHLGLFEDAYRAAHSCEGENNAVTCGLRSVRLNSPFHC